MDEKSLWDKHCEDSAVYYEKKVIDKILLFQNVKRLAIREVLQSIVDTNSYCSVYDMDSDCKYWGQKVSYIGENYAELTDIQCLEYDKVVDISIDGEIVVTDSY